MRWSVYPAMATLLLLSACSPEGSDDPQVGGESHFLSCDPSQPCATGQCVCGVCAVTCDEGCGDGEQCLVADEVCPVARCAPASGCAEGDCPPGLECDGGSCRSNFEYACGGSVEVEPLDGATLLRGTLPGATEEGCRLEDASGPFCDSAPGAIYAVSDGEVLETWCWSTDVSKEPVDEAGISLRGNAAVGLGVGEHKLLDGTIDDSRVVVVGAGRGDTLLVGSLSVEGALARLVGVTIEGDVHVGASANGVALVGVVVRGDLTVEGNNFALIDADVHGSVNVIGNNASVIASRFARAPVLSDEPRHCIGSQTMDANATSICP